MRATVKHDIVRIIRVSVLDRGSEGTRIFLNVGNYSHPEELNVWEYRFENLECRLLRAWSVRVR